MKDRQDIWNRINQIKSNSKAYNDFYGNHGLVGMDHIGGHVGYDEIESNVSLCPSKEFADLLFKKCAQELGIEYDS